jgi:hypothetical protein
LPDRVRLVGGPGALRVVVLQTRRWRHFEGALVIECTGPDGFEVFIPAGWTDLSLAPGGDPEPALEVIGTPDGWRRFGELLAGMRANHPGGARASSAKRR